MGNSAYLSEWDKTLFKFKFWCNGAKELYKSTSFLNIHVDHKKLSDYDFASQICFYYKNLNDICHSILNDICFDNGRLNNFDLGSYYLLTWIVYFDIG